jgi:ribosomal protein S18 acetylase RimI-like enzyme
VVASIGSARDITDFFLTFHQTSLMFEIRKGTVQEIPLIRELTFRVWPQTYASILSQEQIDYMLEMMYSEAALQKQITIDGCQFIIVYEDGNPVGFASYAEVEEGRWKLHKIYILQNQQGKGTGRFVIDHIIDEIKKKNASTLFLQVNKHNNAKAFYEKLGFNEVDFINLDIGNGFFMNDFIMEKKLRSEDRGLRSEV